ncbi:type IV secretion system protein [Thiotrichales bacterium 19S9-12]|nr:type IV secretion system protein [Thiotrichales bacterium 19S9-11]MCF6812177.1 type IV secretion system protein [Thiotrichales bacterium 19S9-12]
MANANQLLGETLLTSIEADFVSKINASVDMVQNYAITFLFAIATLELVLFALAWVIKQDESLGMLAIKVFKIGFIFLFITSFPYILQQFIDGFTLIAFKVSGEEAKQYIFSPGKVWTLGLEGGVSMLKLAVEYGTYNVGVSLMYLILGFGILIIFALIGAQIILVVCVFYAMTLVALLLIPFGVLKPFEDLLHRAVQGLFKASVRVFGLILVLGVGYVVWNKIKLPAVSASTGIEMPLALFFSSLVILVLAYKLPGLLADAVGKIRSNLFDSSIAAPVVSVSGMTGSGGSSYGPGGYMPPSAVGMSSGLQSGGSLAASGASLAQASNIASTQSQPGMVAPATNVNLSTGSGSASAKGAKVSDAASINSSISNDTLRKLKATVKQAMNEKSSK